MKHLTTYKLFEATLGRSNLVTTINDICLELEDDGFSISMPDSFPNVTTDLFIHKSINPAPRVYTSTTRLGQFKYNDVKYITDRIIKYLGSDFQGLYFMDVDQEWNKVNTFGGQKLLKENPNPTIIGIKIVFLDTDGAPELDFIDRGGNY